jgi:plasmid stabilization system protein ParE
MSRELIFLPEVRRDFTEASNYYESISPGRGRARFTAAFQQAVRQIEAGMITHARVFEHFHRAFVPRFPYQVYYRLVEDRAVIAAVLYSRFHPKRVEAMLRRRT